MPSLVIFDWDDVITLGAKEGYYQCYRETLKEFGIVFPEDELHRRIQRKWGQPYPQELAELLREHPELMEEAARIWAEKFWGNTFVDRLSEIEGANQTLKYLAGKYRLAVATGNHPRMLKERLIPRFQVPNVFVQIITSHEIPIEKAKPDPYMLEIIMQDQNVVPEQCVYVGDAENDVSMARNAGIKPIVVLTGHLKREEAEQLGVETILPDITYLKGIL